MPKGLPPNISILLQHAGNRMSSIINQAFIYFEIPSYQELTRSWTQAISDCIIALASLRGTLYITFRPLYILFALFLHYSRIALTILAKHTIHHGIQSCKRGGQEIHDFGLRFLRYQRRLPRQVLYMEFMLVMILIALYTIRRYIQKKRFIQRILHWYKQKIDHAQQKYNAIVKRVAQTSIVVAILLPHVLYAAGFGMVRYFVPSLVEYIVMKTILVQIVSFWIPLVRSIHLIVKWQQIEEEQARSTSESNHRDASLNNKNNMKKNETETSKKNLRNISDLLMYWIVFSVLRASFHIIRLLPFIGGFFPDPREVSDMTTTRWKVQNHRFNILAFRFSHQTCEEIRLFFFLWLFVSSGHDRTWLDHSVEKIQPTRLRITRDSMHHFQTQYNKPPIRLVYDLLKPFLLSITQNINKLQSSVSSAGHGDRYSTSILFKIIKLVSSVFDFLILTKVLSQRMKQTIINTLVQCIGLLPALPSLFMPSYFTKFGVIYVSYIVPAANSAHAEESAENIHDYGPRSVPSIYSPVRFLEYWVLHSFVTSTLSYLTPILSWLPFFHHSTLLLYAGLQLEYVTQTLYGIFTEEMIFFGLIKSPTENYQGRSIILRLISNLSHRFRVAVINPDTSALNSNE